MLKETKFIFCYETEKKAQTDKKYISKFIDYFYEEKRPFNIPVYLEGKTNYKSKNALNNIKNSYKIIKEIYSEPIIKTIYFIDRDCIKNKEDKKNLTDLMNIKVFCDEREYELIIFIKEIENVMGVEYKDKVQACNDFVPIAEKKFEAMDQNKLNKIEPENFGESNIFTILDKYLIPKNRK